MRWTVLDHIEDPGQGVFEDGCGARGPYAWILDGAGTLVEPRFADAGSDAAWLVRQVHDRLMHAAALGNSKTFADVLTRLERDINAAFGDMPGDGTAACPSACMGLLKIDAKTGPTVLVQAAVVADVVVVLETGDGVVTWTDNRVKPFEAQAFALLAGSPRVSPALPPSVLAQIRRNRDCMNRDDGYAVVAPGRPWTDLVYRFEATVPVGSPVVMMSDGFFRLQDVFAAYSVEALYRACVAGRAALLRDELRAFERADPHAARYPRFKIHDDATVMVVVAGEL